ncbi:MAG TPA: FHA domain-containing protein [Acidimicrobiales bacterium]
MAAEVFCNNCGHRNPLGANFCSSCGAVLESVSPENTTITFHPVTPGDPVEEELNVPIEEMPADVGVLVVRRGPKAGSRFALDKDVVTAGRHPESDIFLDDITVSRRHAEIRRTPDGDYEACDTGSLNGTYLNRERIDSARLANGDELQIGKFKLVFFQGAGDEGS